MYLSKGELKEDWDRHKIEFAKSFKQFDFFINRLLSQIDIEQIQKFMHYNWKDITSSQLRNIYNLIKEDKISTPIKRVKIAYVAARTDPKKKGMQILLEKLDKMLSTESIDSECITPFSEACVAYHKYYESIGVDYKKDNQNNNKNNNYGTKK